MTVVCRGATDWCPAQMFLTWRGTADVVRVSRGCERGRIINSVSGVPQSTYVTLKSEFP